MVIWSWGGCSGGEKECVRMQFNNDHGTREFTGHDTEKEWELKTSPLVIWVAGPWKKGLLTGIKGEGMIEEKLAKCLKLFFFLNRVIMNVLTKMNLKIYSTR